LGVILYELLSGLPPFHAPDTRRLEHEIRAGYGRRPLPGSCPPGLHAIVARLLAARPTDRYPSAADVFEDLQRFQAGTDPHALTLGFPKVADDEATRRTKPAIGVESEATRRTDRPGMRVGTPGPPVATSNPAVPAAPKTTAPVKTPRSRPLRTVLMLVALLLVSNELIVGFRGSRLAATAVTRDLETMDDV